VRKIKAVAIVAGMYLAAILSETIMYLGSPTYEGGLGIIVFLAILGFLSTKVGYRWFDFLFAIVPFYGIFYIFRIAYRIAFLPNKDWALRGTSGAGE
jgi:hypothetical protein